MFCVFWHTFEISGYAEMCEGFCDGNGRNNHNLKFDGKISRLSHSHGPTCTACIEFVYLDVKSNSNDFCIFSHCFSSGSLELCICINMNVDC